MSVETITGYTNFTVYPTTDQLDHIDTHVEKSYQTFCEWLTANELHSVTDPESTDEMTGYFVYNIRNEQVAAVILR